MEGHDIMILAGRLVLSPDVEIVPVDTLPAATRAQFTHTASDFVLSRNDAREGSRVIDAPSAALLSCFRIARTVADAVLEYCHTAGADPETVLGDAWPLITRLVDDQLLVAEGDATKHGRNPRLAVGARIERWTAGRCVYALDDTEVHQVRDDAGQWFALKLAPGASSSGFAPGVDHEAAVLEHLAGAVGPRLRGRGMLGDAPFLVLDWCPGSNVESVAAELRALPADERRDALRALTLAVLDAYARLHALGVVHGDVHPRNVVVDRDGHVTVLDFALATRTGVDDGDVPRAGVAFYFEPELARALLAGLPAPPASETGEQFALAALLYLLLTGEHYQDFQLERRVFHSAIRDGAPLAFSARGVEPWPDVEAILATALSKEPADRFPSVAAFAASLRQVERAVRAPDADADHATRPGIVAPTQFKPDDAERVLLGVFLTRAGYGCADAPAPVTDAPTASVMHGAAGVAYALYRLALARDDAELLSLADLWATRAATAHGPEAFADESRGLTPAIYSPVTPYHTAAGVHCVRALIANAAGDRLSLWEAVDAFIAASPVSADEANPDLMLGHPGVLIASALLLDALAPLYDVPRQRLHQHGDRAYHVMIERMASVPAMRDDPRFCASGAAHGWAGALYATLRWCGASGEPVPTTTVARLHELASVGEPWGRGMRWPHSLSPDVPERDTYLAGWCNGTAGLVHLWALAARLTGDAMFDDRADRAAWSTWEHASDSLDNICCGLAGMAYALLARYQATGDRGWVHRASSLASRAARAAIATPPSHPDSLYHGTVGIALLIADLERPELAAMPFFGDEGWRWATRPRTNG
jgi:serine/threonine-protein kinase